jgi:hypothetical protein
LSLQFVVAPGVDAALASLAFTSTAVSGIREVDPIQGRRVNALVRALRSAKRL